MAQHVAGISILNANQLSVADVSGNNSVTSFDAAEIANYVVSASTTGMTGIWKFTPVNRSFASVTTNITGQDFSGRLMGEVSGNWTNTGARPDGHVRPAAGGPEREIAVKLPRVDTPVEKEIVVPVNVQGVANKGIISYEFDLRYDPSTIRPSGELVDLKRTASRGFTAVAGASEPGLLRVAVYGPMPIDGNGVLLNLRFVAVGQAGSVSPISFARIMFNEGESAVTVTDGQVELF